MLAFRVMQMLPVRPPFDALKYATDMAHQYGDFFCGQIGPLRYYQISDPELVREVLVEKADKFHKAWVLWSAVGPFIGNGLLVSEGDFWKRQRKLAQPAFHHKRIESYAQTMVDLSQRALDNWRVGQSYEIFHEMMKLTLNIVSKALFNADVSKEADRVGELVTVLLERANLRINGYATLADVLAFGKRRQEQEALEELNGIVMKIIQEHRAVGTDTGDLLSMLLLATDEADGTGMSDQQLRDEVMTLFLAGHETTANALTWTWYLLSQHPAVEAKLIDELRQAIGDRLPTMHDLPQMPYAEMVIKESMRLYPPAGGMAREPIEDVQLGGYTIPAGSIISINSYVMHHSAKYFPEPKQFIPERFSKEREGQIPRYAYLPFGGGPRICIGNTFAMMEARLLLATIAQSYRLTLDPGQTVVAEQMFTIRPKSGIRMTVAEREAVAVPA
jgi:cytochrome P450